MRTVHYVHASSLDAAHAVARAERSGRVPPVARGPEAILAFHEAHPIPCHTRYNPWRIVLDGPETGGALGCEGQVVDRADLARGPRPVDPVDEYLSWRSLS